LFFIKLSAGLDFVFWNGYSLFLSETRPFLQSKSGIFGEKVNEVAAKKEA
jgi:hypothetical protein